MSFRRSRKPLSRAARLTKEWLGFVTADETGLEPQPIFTVPGNTYAAWIIDPDAALQAFDEPTVMRILVNVWPSFNALSLSEANLISLGIIVANELPGALSRNSNARGDLDWLWVQYMGLVAPPTAAAPTTAGLGNGAFADIRTKRRLEAGQGLALCLAHEASAGALGSAAATMVQGRILYGHS